MSLYVRPASVRWGDRAAAWSVFFVLIAVYTATFTGLPDSRESEVEFQTTSALVRTGGLALTGTPEAQEIASSGVGAVPGRGRREGRIYSWLGVGQAVAAVPLYLAGRGLALLWPEIERRHAAPQADGPLRSEYFAHLLVGWRNPLLGALTAMLIVLTARRMGVRRTPAWIAGLTYGLCTFAWPQARSTLGEVQVTFLLFAAFHLIVLVREGFARLMAPPAHVLAATGLCLGGAALTRISSLPAVLVVGLAAWRVLEFGHKRLQRAWVDRELPLRRRLPTQSLDLLLPLVLCLGLFALLNWLRFDSPIRTGYESAVLSGAFFSSAPHLGFAGLLAAPGKGLLWMAPAILLVPVGLRAARRNDELLWPWVLIAAGLALIAPVAFTRTWHGAWTYGPRFLLPILPFAWLGFALALESWRVRGWIRRAAFFLCAAGFLVQLPAVLVDHTTHEDLALQAAELAWPEIGGPTQEVAEDARLVRVQWDWRFAAPWAHWRILRHRVAGLGDVFEAGEIFFVGGESELSPREDRRRGFRHLAWVDLHERLGGSAWPAILICLLLLGTGVVLAARAVDPAAL